MERQRNPFHPCLPSSGDRQAEELPAVTGGAAGLQDTQTQGVLVVPLAPAAALAPSVFSRVNATEAIPSTWEEDAPACAPPEKTLLLEKICGGAAGSHIQRQIKFHRRVGGPEARMDTMPACRAARAQAGLDEGAWLTERA